MILHYENSDFQPLLEETIYQEILKPQAPWVHDGNNHPSWTPDFS